MGQVCPSSIICWLQSAQNFPCLHGIQIHVEFRGPRHTMQLLPPMLVTSSSSFSSVSSESLRAIGLNFLHPIVLLTNTKNSHGVYSPLRNFSLNITLCASIWTYLGFLARLISLPSRIRPMSLSVSTMMSFNCDKNYHILG